MKTLHVSNNKISKRHAIKLGAASLVFSLFFINGTAQTTNANNRSGGNGVSSKITVVSLGQTYKNSEIVKTDNIPCRITVSPNPTNTGQMNVSIPCMEKGGGAIIYIYDASGGFLSLQKATAETVQNSVDLSAYNQGTYYLKIAMGDTDYSYKILNLTQAGGSVESIQSRSKF
jgi:hypothetical protein